MLVSEATALLARRLGRAQAVAAIVVAVVVVPLVELVQVDRVRVALAGRQTAVLAKVVPVALVVPVAMVVARPVALRLAGMAVVPHRIAPRLQETPRRVRILDLVVVPHREERTPALAATEDLPQAKGRRPQDRQAARLEPVNQVRVLVAPLSRVKKGQVPVGRHPHLSLEPASMTLRP